MLIMKGINITFSTAWYEMQSKFDTATYMKWIDNMLSNVNNYYLVVYTDEKGAKQLHKYAENPNINIIVKPLEEFYLWKYKDQLIENHGNNLLLKNRVTWEVNMLWCEKINFVYETMRNKIFDTDYYGWCDIGYFRDSEGAAEWPNPNKINGLNNDLIFYACVNNDSNYIFDLMHIIANKHNGLPHIPIPADQVSLAGGFFITHKSNIVWWRSEYYAKLHLYIKNDYLIKDDQIILADCVFSNFTDKMQTIKFNLIREFDSRYDNWFMFRRYLA